MEKEEKEKKVDEEKAVSTKLRESTRERLAGLGRFGENFDSVITRKLDELDACTSEVVKEKPEKTAEEKAELKEEVAEKSKEEEKSAGKEE